MWHALQLPSHPCYVISPAHINLYKVVVHPPAPKPPLLRDLSCPHQPIQGSGAPSSSQATLATSTCRLLSTHESKWYTLQLPSHPCYIDSAIISHVIRGMWYTLQLPSHPCYGAMIQSALQATGNGKLRGARYFVVERAIWESESSAFFTMRHLEISL